MKNLKPVFSLGFATLLVISAVGASFGKQTQAAKFSKTGTSLANQTGLLTRPTVFIDTPQSAGV